MRYFDRCWFEVRRAGRATLIAPLAVCAALAAGAALADRATAVDAVARTLLFATEMAVPLIGGVCAASLVGRDPLVELHLSLPASYRGTLVRRLIAMCAAGAIVATGICVVLVVSGWWTRWPYPRALLLGQLTWAAPLCWLAALGLLAAVVLRAPAAAAAAVTAPWLLEQLLPDQVQAHRWSRLLYLFATTSGRDADWLANRTVLLSNAAVLAGAAWLLLARAERLLGGEAE